MRILNSTAFWGLLIATAFIYAMMQQPSYATSQIVPCPDTAVNCWNSPEDKCFNLPGTQTIDRKRIDYRFKVRTPKKGDCRLILGIR